MVVLLACGHATGRAAGDGVSAAGAGFGGAVRTVMVLLLLLVLMPLWCCQ